MKCRYEDIRQILNAMQLAFKFGKMFVFHRMEFGRSGHFCWDLGKIQDPPMF
jgi:hypothetical protein